MRRIEGEGPLTARSARFKIPPRTFSPVGRAAVPALLSLLVSFRVATPSRVRSPFPLWEGVGVRLYATPACNARSNQIYLSSPPYFLLNNIPLPCQFRLPLNQSAHDSVYQMGGSTSLMTQVWGVAPFCPADGTRSDCLRSRGRPPPMVPRAPRRQPSRRSSRHRRRRCRIAVAAARDASDDGAAQSRRPRAPARRSAGSHRRRDYHRWLTPDAFTARFGPTAADLARVSRWLKRKKASPSASADASTREVAFTGTVAQAQNAFGVKIAATHRRPSLFQHRRSHACPRPRAAGRIRSTASTTCCTARRWCVDATLRQRNSPASIVNNTMPAFGPPDIYTFYDETPLLNANPAIDGSGNGCIAVVEDSNIDAARRRRLQHPVRPARADRRELQTSRWLIDSDPGQNSDEDETMVDVSYSHAVAPGSSIRMYLGDQSTRSPRRFSTRSTRR